MAKAFFYIETQWDNLGDALINRALIRQIAAHADVELGIAPVPEHFKDMIGRQFLNQYKLDEHSTREKFLLKVLGEQIRGTQCYVFLSPGGWIGELDGRLNLRSWAHTALYHIMALSGVRICQLGVSYEDIGPKLGWQLRARSPAMYRHFVRDAVSRDTMRARGVRIDGLCPDLAFSEFGQEPHDHEDGAITFSFRSDQYPQQLDDIKSFITAFLAISGTGRPVYIVTQVKKDAPGNKAIAAWLKDTFGITAQVDNGSHSIELTEKLYERSSVVVSNRLHALLLGGAMGNVMIAAPIGAQNKKVRALFDDIGLGTHVYTDAEQVRSAPEQLELAMKTPFRGDVQREQVQSCVTSLFNGVEE